MCSGSDQVTTYMHAKSHRCTIAEVACSMQACELSLTTLGAEWLALCVQSIPNVSVPLLCLQVRGCANLQICQLHGSQGICFFK